MVGHGHTVVAAIGVEETSDRGRYRRDGLFFAQSCADSIPYIAYVFVFKIGRRRRRVTRR